MSATLSSAEGVNPPILQRTEPLLVVDPRPSPLTGTIAGADYDGKLIPTLQRQFGLVAVPLASAPAEVDDIIISSSGAPRFALDLNNVQHTRDVQNTDDPGLYAEESVGKVGDVAKYGGMASGKASVELFFVDSYFDNPGSRLFDIALNGKTVLKNFDIIGVSGGKNRAAVQKLTADCPDGILTVSIPRVGKDKAIIAAIRITDSAGTVVREVFRRQAYQSPTGETWNPIKPGGYAWNKVLPTVLDRVRNGSRLVLLTMGGDDAGDAATALADKGVLTYSGSLGFDKTSWMGYWYFSRKHWLLDGLPSDCVLDWQYQAAAGGDGVKVDAPGMEPVIAVGMNHSPVLGFGTVVVPCGKGEIVLFAIPGLNPAFIENDAGGFQPITAKRLIFNALRGDKGALGAN